MEEQRPRTPGWVWVALVVAVVLSLGFGLFSGGLGGYLLGRRSAGGCPMVGGLELRRMPRMLIPGWPGLRGLLPSEPTPVPPATEYGAIIVSVVEASPADQAGLQRGDIITAVDGKQLSEEQDLPTVIQSYRPGDRVRLTVWRGAGGAREELTVRVTLGEKRTEDGRIVAYLGVTVMPAPAWSETP